MPRVQCNSCGAVFEESAEHIAQLEADQKELVDIARKLIYTAEDEPYIIYVKKFLTKFPSPESPEDYIEQARRDSL